MHLQKHIAQCAFTKAASVPAWWQSENTGPRFFEFIFRCCLPSWIFFQFFELSTKVVFARAACDTLRTSLSSFPARRDKWRWVFYAELVPKYEFWWQALQSPGPGTKPRSPQSSKVYFKVRKMPLWIPQKNGPKSPLECHKSQWKCPKCWFWAF